MCVGRLIYRNNVDYYCQVSRNKIENMHNVFNVYESNKKKKKIPTLPI